MTWKAHALPEHSKCLRWRRC